MIRLNYNLMNLDTVLMVSLSHLSQPEEQKLDGSKKYDEVAVKVAKIRGYEELILDVGSSSLHRNSAIQQRTRPY